MTKNHPMKSARIIGPNEPLAVIESDTPKPQGNEVIVIYTCGRVVMILEMDNL